MYLTHYHLNEKPFQMSADPKFIWFGEKHTKALATLEYGLQENKGFLLLTGDVDTGKSLVIGRLLKKIDDNCITATIPEPVADSMAFYNILSREFKMNRKFNSKGDFLINFKKFLREAHLENKKILLIIDEAQKISNEQLEEIRLLSNIELENAKLLNIFFVGQNHFNSILSEDCNKATRQRIGTIFHLDSLNDSETHKYINHRLKVAGSDREIFNSRAINEIYHYSAGSPRLINSICDCALMKGSSLGVDKINETVVRECAHELRLPSVSENTEHDGINRPEENERGASLNKISIARRRFNLAVSIFALIIISAFICYDIYLNHFQSSAVVEDAYSAYSQYKQRINRAPIAQLSAATKPKARLKTEKIIKKNNKANVDDKNALPLSFKIFFQNNSNEFSKNNLEILKRSATSIKSYPNSEILIKGYTDFYGNYWHNKKVSKIRANLVKNYLVEHGFKASRIKTIGLGPENPIDSNATVIDRKMNLWVEIKIILPNQALIL